MYRSDHDAALSRIAALEQELREAHREIARQRAPVAPVAVTAPVVSTPYVPHEYEDSWKSTSAEADRQLRQALSDAKAYRRKQDANGTNEEPTKALTTWRPGAVTQESDRPANGESGLVAMALITVFTVFVMFVAAIAQ